MPISLGCRSIRGARLRPALRWLEAAAERGDAQAQFILGSCSRTGRASRVMRRKGAVAFSRPRSRGYAYALYASVRATVSAWAWNKIC